MLEKAFSLYLLHLKSEQFQNFPLFRRRRSRFCVDFTRLFGKLGSSEPQVQIKVRVCPRFFCVRIEVFFRTSMEFRDHSKNGARPVKPLEQENLNV